MSEPRDILTTARPADRIPTVGVQLSADGTADLSSIVAGIILRAEPFAPRAAGMDAFEPVALNLWDSSADSLPDTWTK